MASNKEILSGFTGGLKELLEKTLAEKLNDIETREKVVSERESKVNKILKAVETIKGGPVSLRVGQKVYVTTRDVLLSSEDSFFQGLLNPKFLREPVKGGLDDSKDVPKTSELFIPRDGDVFAFVLEYLTYGKLISNEMSESTLAKLEIDADYYLLPALKKQVKYLREGNTETKSANGSVCVWYTTLQMTNGYKSWNTPGLQNNSCGLVFNGTDTFTSTKGGTYRVCVRVNGSTSGANSDHVAIHVQGVALHRCFGGLNTGHYATFHLNEIIQVNTGGRVQIYQQINSNNLAETLDNSVSFERL